MWSATARRRAADRDDAIKILVLRVDKDPFVFESVLLDVAKWYMDARMLPTLLNSNYFPELVKKRKVNKQWWMDFQSQSFVIFLSGLPNSLLDGLNAFEDRWKECEFRVGQLLSLENKRLKLIFQSVWDELHADQQLFRKDSPFTQAFVNATFNIMEFPATPASLMFAKKDEDAIINGFLVLIKDASVVIDETENCRLVKGNYDSPFSWEGALVQWMGDAIVTHVYETGRCAQGTPSFQRFIRHAIMRGYLLGLTTITMRIESMATAILARQRAVRRLVKSVMRNVVKECAAPSNSKAVSDASDSVPSPEDVQRELRRKERAARAREERRQREAAAAAAQQRNAPCRAPETPTSAPFVPPTTHRRAGEKAQSMEAARQHAEKLREHERERVAAIEARVALVRLGSEIGGGV